MIIYSYLKIDSLSFTEMEQTTELSIDSSLLTSLRSAIPTEIGNSPLMGEFIMDKIVNSGKSFPDVGDDKIKLKANFHHFFDKTDTEHEPYSYTLKQEATPNDIVANFLGIRYEPGEVEVAVRELERVSTCLIFLFEKTGVDLKELKISAVVGADDRKGLSIVTICATTFCAKNGFDKI